MKENRFSFIGQRLRQLRGGQSQTFFAEMIGVPFRTYQRYEAGERAPKPDVLERIAKITGRPVEWIMSGEYVNLTDRVAESRSVYGVSSLDEKIMRYVREMSEEEKRALLKFFRAQRRPVEEKIKEK